MILKLIFDFDYEYGNKNFFFAHSNSLTQEKCSLTSQNDVRLEFDEKIDPSKSIQKLDSLHTDSISIHDLFVYAHYLIKRPKRFKRKQFR